MKIIGILKILWCIFFFGVLFVEFHDMDLWVRIFMATVLVWTSISTITWWRFALKMKREQVKK